MTEVIINGVRYIPAPIEKKEVKVDYKETFKQHMIEKYSKKNRKQNGIK